jgi:flagellar protein FliO/FliZ
LKLKVWCSLIGLVLAWLEPVWAGEPPASPSVSPNTLAFDSLLRVSGGLLVVLLVMILLFWLMKRTRLLKPTGQADMKVLGSLAVGQRERIVLAQVGEAQVLVGVAPGQVNSLYVLQTPVVLDPGEKLDSKSFVERLEGLLNKKEVGEGHE